MAYLGKMPDFYILENTERLDLNDFSPNNLKKNRHLQVGTYSCSKQAR